MNRGSYNPETDLWLQSQIEGIRGIEYPKGIDVCDAVMEKINTQPQPMALKRRNRRVTSAVIAACLTGLVVATVLVKRPSEQASATNPELAYRFYDVYKYCNNYADEEESDDAAFYENPVTFIL